MPLSACASACALSVCLCVLCYRVGRTGRAGDKEGVAITLLLANKDAHFAGLLVNSLSLGGQEVPRDLHALAMKVGRTEEDEGGGGGGHIPAQPAQRITVHLRQAGKGVCMLYHKTASSRHRPQQLTCSWGCDSVCVFCASSIPSPSTWALHLCSCLPPRRTIVSSAAAAGTRAAGVARAVEGAARGLLWAVPGWALATMAHSSRSQVLRQLQPLQQQVLVVLVLVAAAFHKA